MKTSYVPVRLLGAACALVMALGTILNGGAAPPQEPAPHALEALGFRPEAASAGKPGFDVLGWRTQFADLAAIEFREVQPGTDLVLRGSGSAMEALIAFAPATTPSSLVLAVPAGLRMGVDGAAEGVHDGTPVRVMATFFQTRGADLVRLAGGLLLSADQLTFWAERTEKRAPLVVSLRVTFGAAAPIESAVQSFGPGAATLTATLQTDADSNSQVTPGDTLRYRLTIPNAGAAIPNVVARIPLSVYHTSVPGTLNVSPFALDLADTTPEDVPLPLVLAGTDAEGQVLTYTIVTPPAHGALVPASPGSANQTYTPEANYHGPDSFTYEVNDGRLDSNEVGTVTLTVTPRNDAPSFTKGADVTVLENSAAYSQTGWATAISAGGPDEVGQTLTFNVTDNTNAALFSVLPAVASNGTLTFTPATDANGSATITLTLSDDGGTANGGADTSAAQTFLITVSGVNAAPSFTKGADQTVLEDAGAQTAPGWATAIDPGAGESGQVLTFQITNNTNPALFAAGPAVSGTTGDLIYTPAAHANGTAMVTLRLMDNGGTANGGVDASPTQTFVITVTSVNDAPSFTKGADVTVLENSGAFSQTGWATAISAGPANESAQTLTFVVTNNTNAALFSAAPVVASNGDLTFTPAADASGSATITLRLDDNGGVLNGGVNQSATQTFEITVSGINSAPSFTKGADQTVTEDAGAQTASGWATAIDPGVGETGQVLTFEITNNTNAALFSAGPAVSGTTGDLTYTPALNANGTATITLRLTDDGGTANGGVDASPTQTFVINVTTVNDAPSFTKGADETVLEDSGPQTVNAWATTISAGPSDESAQTLTFTVTNNTNAALFSAAPAVNATTGNLTYTPAGNANGTATITLRLDDNGGVLNGGVNQSATQTFVITITNVNDAPSFTPGANQTVNEDAGAQSVSSFATAISAGPSEGSQSLTFNIVSNTNGALFSSAPAIASNGTLTYTPAANTSGTATITYNLQDNGGTANGGVDITGNESFTITVNSVNDAPSFTKGADQTVLEDSGVQTVPGWATAISAGPSDESAQVLTFTVTNNTNAALFSAGPAVNATNGNLTYTPAADANGTATITLRLDDDGGVLNGGVNQSATQTFVVTVTNVNDAPSFTPGVNQTVNEDAGAQSVPGFISGISAGPSEGSQTLTFNIVSNTNSALFSAGPAIASNGTLTYTPVANANGTATITYNLQDNGGTANGGVDITANQSFTITVSAVNDAPVAAAKSLTALANFLTSYQIDLAANGSGDVTDVDNNDAGFTTQDFTLTSLAALSCAGCTATIVDGNLGTFSFEPPPGLTGTFTLTYRVTDNGNPTPGVQSVPGSATGQPGVITITVSGPMVWFVDSTAPGGGNGTWTGTNAKAFQTLAQADAVNIAGDRVFVLNNNGSTINYAGGLAMQTTERLIGQGVTGASFDTVVLGGGPPAGTAARPAINGVRPTIQGTVVLADGVTVTGVNFNPSSAVPAMSATALATTAAITIDQVNVSGAGGGTRALSLTSVTATGAGAINVSNAIFSNTSGAEVFVSAGNIPIAFANSATLSNNAGRVIDIQSRTASAVSFAGAITETGTAGTGIFLSGNGTSTFSFSGGLTLNGNNTTFTATNPTLNGTLTITGTNTIGATTVPAGPALNVTNATILVGGVTFQRISATGGQRGITVNNTGSGAFTVTGTGSTDGSGGTIQTATLHGAEFISASNISLSNMNFTGNGTGQTVAGSDASCGGNLLAGNNLSCVSNIRLQTVDTIALTNLNVTNGGQMGINGNGVSTFSLSNSVVTGNGNEVFENGLTFQNLTGTSTISNSIIRDNFSHQVNVTNIASSSTLVLGVTGTRTNNAYPTQDTSTTMIGRTSVPVASEAGILFNTLNTSTNVNMTLNLAGVVMNNNYPANAVLLNPNSASGSLGGTVDDSSFDRNAGGVIIQAQNGMGGTYNVLNSEFNQTDLQSILYAGLNPFNGTLQGTIQGNTIGTAGQVGSACTPGGSNCTGIDINMIGGSGAIRVRIGGGGGQGNTVQQFDGTGIRVAGNGAGTLHANIENNTVQNPLGLIARGIDTNMGTTAGATIAGCFGISNNLFAGTFEDPGVGVQLRIHTRVRFTATHRLPGYGGAADNDTAVAAFISGNNPGAGGQVFSESPSGSGAYPGGAGCTTP